MLGNTRRRVSMPVFLLCLSFEALVLLIWRDEIVSHFAPAFSLHGFIGIAAMSILGYALLRMHVPAPNSHPIFYSGMARPKSALPWIERNRGRSPATWDEAVETCRFLLASPFDRRPELVMPAAQTIFALDVFVATGADGPLLEIAGFDGKLPADYSDRWRAVYPRSASHLDDRAADEVAVALAYRKAVQDLGHAIPTRYIRWIRNVDRELWYAMLNMERHNGAFVEGVSFLLLAQKKTSSKEKHASSLREASEKMAASAWPDLVPFESRAA